MNNTITDSFLLLLKLFCYWFLLVYFHISVIVLFISVYLFYKSPAAAKSLQLSLTLCDHIDGSPPGSPVPGILQARTLEWVAISSSNARKSPSSLLNVSMSSWSVPPLFFCDLVSSVLSLLWVVIHLDCLSPLDCCSGSLSYSFILNILLCHFILCNFLCLWFPFLRQQDHSSSCFRCLLPPGRWGWLVQGCRLPCGRGWCLPPGG